MLLFDAHLDLSLNAIEYNRDLREPLEAVRARERGQFHRKDCARGVLTFPEMRRGGLGICVATQIARYVKPSNPLPGWHSPEQAWAQTRAQLAWYREMEDQGHLFQIVDRAGLARMRALWSGDSPPDAPIGYVLSLEGADSIVTMRHLERSHAEGLRALGPAHYGPGTYAQGTDASGGIGAKGRELLSEMERLGIILDATHLCDESFWEALEHFGGRVWASHNNCRALVPGCRQFSDEQIKVLIERGAVIGAALDAWMMVPGWSRRLTTPQSSGLLLESMVEHIDRVCQLAGNARHAGIGSDLDGGFGREQTPADLESIADLARLPGMLAARGYSQEDILGIAHGNFLRFLAEALPA